MPSQMFKSNFLLRSHRVSYLVTLALLLCLISPLAAVAGGASETNSKPISKFDLGKYQYCGDDSDCIKAVNGCCDCANGGVDVAVNKKRLEAFSEHFNCLHVVCSRRARIPACGSGLVSCISHKCSYLEENKVKF